MLFNFSSIIKLYQKEPETTLNISAYLNTIYFNIFQNKKLIAKYTISSAKYYILREQLKLFKIACKNETPYCLETIFNYWDNEVNKFIPNLLIGFNKDPNKNKYKPYALTIKSFKNPEFSGEFLMSNSSIYSTKKNNKIEFPTPEYHLDYFYWIFYHKLNLILTLSLDQEATINRQKQYK